MKDSLSLVLRRDTLSRVAAHSRIERPSARENMSDLNKSSCWVHWEIVQTFSMVCEVIGTECRGPFTLGSRGPRGSFKRTARWLLHMEMRCYWQEVKCNAEIRGMTKDLVDAVKRIYEEWLLLLCVTSSIILRWNPGCRAPNITKI